MFLAISQCRKSLVMSTAKPYNFMQLFWTFVGVPVWPKCFFICARNLDEYFTKLIPSKFLNFFLVSFSVVLLVKVQNKGYIYKNLDNYHNHFLMFCSYEKSCFCLVVIKINVKVLGNYWVPYQQMFFSLPGLD